jgi:hypothetical protein
MADLMNSGMNGKPSWINLIIGLTYYFAFHVYFYEGGGSDFFEHHAVWINQEVVLISWQTR